MFTLKIWKSSLLLLLLLSAVCRPEEQKLIILHTNDIHGHIEAYEGGGLTRVAEAVEQFRRENPGRVILLDGGDTSLGTPLSGLYHGKPTAEIMALMKYDAITLGNHEFNWGKEVMASLTEGMNAPVLCANLVSTEEGTTPYPPFTSFTRNGVKIGVVGLVAQDTYRRAPASATAGWEFLSPTQAVRATLPQMPGDLDLVIALTHIGVEADRTLAGGVPELDLIVGGHSHTPLSDPVMIGDTPIVQAGCYGQFLGILQLSVDPDLHRVKVTGYRLHPLGPDSPERPEAAEVVQRYSRELAPKLDQVVAQVQTEVSKKADEDTYDTPLGNLIADVFRAEAKTDLAFYNRGGVRFDMEAGPLTVRQVHKLFPFDDPVVVLEATGEQIRKIVEQGTVDGEGPLSPSGLRAEIKNGRVARILVGDQPLDEAAVYTLATTNFLAGGGDGMAVFSQLKRSKTLPFTRDVLLQYLTDHDQLSSPPTGRFQVHSE